MAPGEMGRPDIPAGGVGNGEDMDGGEANTGDV